MPESKHWAPADWAGAMSFRTWWRVAGWKAGAELGLEDTTWPAAVKIPGGRWTCRLKDEYVHDGDRNCFSSTGDEQLHVTHGPINKSMQEASATRAGNA